MFETTRRIVATLALASIPVASGTACSEDSATLPEEAGGKAGTGAGGGSTEAGADAAGSGGSSGGTSGAAGSGGIASQCTPGEKDCDGSIPRLCSASGVWQTSAAACAETEVCLVGDCYSAVGRVSAGSAHACAITLQGAALCWGVGTYGQLGNNSTALSAVPVQVSGLTTNCTAVSAGYQHSCAVCSGGAKCWGGNSNGQLGNNSENDTQVPVDVTGLSQDVSVIAAAGAHTCALTSGGGVKCWGANSSGQLGNKSKVDSSVPVDVDGLGSGVLAISARNSHTCALLTGGTVKCWGANDGGELGNGQKGVSSDTPVEVQSLAATMAAIAAGGAFSCAASSAGALSCWGQLQSQSPTPSTPWLTPTQIAGLASGVQGASGGQDHACVVRKDGSAACFGNNGAGALGNGDNTDSEAAVEVSGLASGVAAVTAGGGFSCALLASGGVKCWGLNSVGQLGNGTKLDSHTPVDVAGFSP